jgi:transcriptional regulator with XRE-family HTH domain
MASKKRARNPTVTDVEIGKRLRAIRVDHNMSQSELGRHLGVTFQQIQKYEMGKNRISLSRAVQICDVLKTSLSELVERELGNVQFNHARWKLAAALEGLAPEIATAFRKTIEVVKNNR